jgi:hypothetical protein
MLSPHIHAALAHERHQAFLAQAEAYRRNRQAQLGRRRPGRSRLLGRWPGSAVTRLLRSVRTGLVHHEAGALRYEIMLGPAESCEPKAGGAGE